MSNTRTRLMLVRSYLLERTDERHAVPLRELIAYLECEGIGADPRGVSADLAALKESGLDVCVRRGRTREYYVGKRTFERGELRLLIDMVRANRFLTQPRTNALLQKLASLASRREAALLLSYGGQRLPFSSESETAFAHVERILDALEQRRKISFFYCESPLPEPLPPRRDEKAYAVSPFLLVYAEERYYLVADHPAHEGLAHYRLDRIANLRVLAEPAVPLDASFDANAYIGGTFPMCPAGQRWVRLAFDRPHLGAMIDRFGSRVPMEQLDERTFTLYAPVCVGGPFFGWVFQFCGGVRILAPDDVRERMLLMLDAVRRQSGYEIHP